MDKREAIEALGISSETIARAIRELPLERLVEDEEFRRRRPEKRDYRKDAINRLVEARVPWSSSCNTLFEVASMCLSVECPYCGVAAKASGGGGGSHMASVNFNCCGCGARINLSMSWDGISFEPPNA